MSFLPKTLHQAADWARDKVAKVGALIPTSNESKFARDGTLTAQEFVEAGDQLVAKFPTWKWCPAAKGKEVSWLPASKQYLISRNVPSRGRIKDLEKAAAHNREEDGWTLTGPDGEPADAAADDMAEMTLEDTPSGAAEAKADTGAPAEQQAAASAAGGAGGEEEIPDMCGFEEVDAMVQQSDPAALPSTTPAAASGSSVPSNNRTYDLSITYDKYYQTPRLWLVGYDAAGALLSPARVFEDVQTEYAEKTVTVDPHPCTGVPSASIHPCRHAAVLKHVVDGWIANGKPVRADLSLFVFLKFMSGVVPTIHYDATMDIDMCMHAHTQGGGNGGSSGSK